jgi:hypothetical protein
MLTKKYVAVIGLVLGLFALAANPARANVITASQATVDCTGYNVCVTVEFLALGTPTEVDFSFALTPSSGPAIPVTGMIDFTPTAFTETHCASGTWPGSPLTEPFTVTGMSSIPTEPPLAGFNPFTTTFNGTTSTSIDLMCSTGTGCPATIGFWKNTKKHPFPPSVESSGLTIGGVTYSASELLTILNANGGNAVVILGRQLVGALINIAAGATDSLAADMAIANAESLLSTNSLNLLTSDVAPSSVLGQALLADEVTLNSYNNGNFGTCTNEGSGLTL